MENLETLTDNYFTTHLQSSLQALLAPIAGEAEAGAALAGSPLYGAIRTAREEEDASLPLGAWEHELKRADWPAVSRQCVQGLATQSKDLQLLAWLLEAEIHRQGFAALAPCLFLTERICQTYGEKVFPRDGEHRENMFRWIDSKLLTALRRVPFTGADSSFGWADWEQAQRNEQVRAALGKEGEKAQEGTTLQQFTAALACMLSQDIQARQAELQTAMQAIADLSSTLEALSPELGFEPVGFNTLKDLLENISLMLAGEARKRGLDRAPEPPPMAMAQDADNAQAHDEGIQEGDRGKLYMALSSIAEQLARLEPHSPAPYLVKRAVAWGRLNTAQLYSEVFVRCGGQINIFELLGLEDQIAAQEENAAR